MLLFFVSFVMTSGIMLGARCGWSVTPYALLCRCPCNYAGNAESNKRWCCGDFPHLDMSEWALSKITKETSRYG
jgi:hypothetical protein